MSKFLVRLAQTDGKPRKRDKVYAVCTTRQEAREISEILTDAGEPAWVDVLAE